MGDETKKSHNSQKNSWNRWLCLLTYRPNLVFCSHHQSLFGTQVVFMWRMFLRLFCINRVWLWKKLTLWSKSGYVFIKRGKEWNFFFIPTLLSCKKFEFILSSIFIYLFIPDQTLKALLEMLRDQQLLMTSIRFMA